MSITPSSSFKAAIELIAVGKAEAGVAGRKDLELRGPGEVLGTRQTGLLQLRIADLRRDQYLLPEATRAADLLLQRWPQQVTPLVRRWVGAGTRYGEV